MFTPKPQPYENAQHEMDFDQPVVNIGSHPDNDIVLSGAGVRPFHVSLVLQNGQCQVMQLDASGEIRLDGKMTGTTRFDIQKSSKRLDLGAHSLLLEYNKVFDCLHVRVRQAMMADALQAASSSPEAAARVSVMPAGESAILVDLFSQVNEIEVGQTAVYEIEVVNAGPLVANFNILFEGVSQEWVKIVPDEINLNEGQRAMVNISVSPPRSPESTAGTHSVTAVVFSENYPGHQAVTPLTLTIKPYYEFTLGNLSPREQNVYWRRGSGKTNLPISNMGNSPADFQVSAMDDENGCSFDFAVGDGLQLNRQATLNIKAGQTIPLPIEVTPHKRPIFSLQNKRYMYTTTVQVVNQLVNPQMVSGSVTNHPLFGWWSIVAGVLTLAILLFILLQPNIYRFEVAAGKDVIELGDTTRLEWSVSPFATRVSISNVDQALNNGQTSLTIAPSQSTTYDLTSGNWLSGLLNMDRHETRTVLVVPPTPNINVFSVDYTEVALGKPVKIRWSITQADQAFLTVDDVVYELTKDKFSGEQEVVLGKDALVILEAKNAGGKALRSYFVNVVPPNITVNTFTVWVRPASGTAALPGEGYAKLASPSQSPDPSFPEKLVELVPDATSDSGYRVYFNQPDRELDKGEQVMLEWEVAGTDDKKVKIAPFAEELPAKGNQPFFPQESMNFVMTAKSGELEVLHMLPVKVFDGIPPTAPKIDFFQAAPASMLGPGTVEFAWSVSGEWTRVQLSTGDTVIADYLNPQGFKKVPVSKSATYILTAWNGKLSTAKPLDITVNPALIPVKLKITNVYPDTGRFLVGDKITVSVEFIDLPKDKPAPSGTIIVSDGTTVCEPVATLPQKSCTLTFTTPTTDLVPKKILVASYSGDKIYLQGTSDPFAGEVTVSSPSVNLTPSFYLAPPVDKPLPIVVANQQFTIDQKLYATISINPVGAVLPEDTKGKISLSICKQETVTGTPTIVSGSCILTTAVTVTVANGVGTADVLIPGFPGAGVYALRFDYRHDDNKLNPATGIQYNLNVTKMGIYLTLQTSTDDPCYANILDGATCRFGYSDPKNAHAIFYIHRSLGKDYLESVMPKPNINLFRFFEVDSANNPLPPDYTCTIGTDTVVVQTTPRIVYTLDCTLNIEGKASIKVNYDHDNANSTNYFMGIDAKTDYVRSPFTLRPIRKTAIQLNVAEYQVGQVIALTPSQTGSLSLIAEGTTTQITGVVGKIKITVKDSAGAAIPGALGVVPAITGEAGGSTCITDGTGISTIDVDEICQVFFKKAGTWNLLLEFAGDSNNSPSSAEIRSVVVKNQTGLTTHWWYSADNWNTQQDWNTKQLMLAQYQSWQSPPYSAKGRIVLGFPLDASKTFSSKALEGLPVSLSKSIITSQNSSASCTLNPTAPTVAYNPQTGESYVEFSLSCDSLNTQVSISAELKDPNNNFAIAAGEILSRQVFFTDRADVSHLTVSIKRGADSHEEISGETIGTLLTGEEYQISLELGPMWADGVCDWYVDASYNMICNPVRTRQQAIDLMMYSDYPNNTIFRTIDLNFPQGSELVKRILSISGSCSLGTDKITMPLSAISRENDYGTPGTGCADCITDIWLKPAQPCTLIFKTLVGDTAFPVGKEQVVFSLAQFRDNFTSINYSINDSYSTNGLNKNQVSFTLDKPFDTQAAINSPDQIVTMTLTNPITGSTLDPILDQSGSTDPAKWFDPGYPDCMGLSGVVNVETNVVVWTLKSATALPCAGTFEINYKGNENFIGLLDKVNNIDYPPLVLQDVAFAQPKATKTVLTRTLGSSSVSYGTKLSFKAVVSVVAPATGIPTGAVTFTDGTNPLDASCTDVALDVNGAASCSNITLAEGSYTITASYTPTGPYGTNTDATLPQTITSATTGTTLTLDTGTNPSAYGDTVTFKAKVVTPSGGSGIPNAGTVTFTDTSTSPATVLCTGRPLDASGAAFCTPATSNLPVGAHTIRAVYTDSNGNYATSNNTLAHTVKEPTTTSITWATGSSSPTTFGDSVTFESKVKDSSNADLTVGTVTFRDTSTTPATVLCNAVSLASGVASCTKSTLTGGSHIITATYNPASNYLTSTNPDTFSHTVNPASTSTTLGWDTGSSSPSAYGTSVTFKATVVTPSDGSGVPVTGTVTFTDTSSSPVAVLCSNKTLDTSGIALCLINTLAVGDHTITAAYSDSAGNYNPSDTGASALGHTVNKANTTTTFVVDTASNPDIYTVTVKQPAGNTTIPTGIVKFCLAADTLDLTGATPTCTGPGGNSAWLPNDTYFKPLTGGVFSWPRPNSGTQYTNVIAVYFGSDNFNVSASTPLIATNIRLAP